jgi:hypothetical protein
VDLFFGYLMYEECIMFLFYKEKYEESMKLMKREYVKLSEELSK